MKVKFVISIFLVFCLAFPAGAHRLNEYLHATTITLSKDSISLRLHLTPGSDVAAKALSLIDPNGDGIITDAEQLAYAMTVLRGFYLNIDGEQAPLKVLSWKFSTVEEIKTGMGEIQLFLASAIPGKGASHHLVFKNHQQQGISVYLVNCLLPNDTSVVVTSQSRNIDQSLYELDFSTGQLRPAATVTQLSIGKADHLAAIKTYFFEGIRHILTGYDHLLFICALVLGAAGLWDLVKVVTAFTIAHSITLTLAAFGLAHLPGYIVEPVIAASIVFVAVQNIFWPKQATGAVRFTVAFFFGLFHGLGFAGGLLEVMHAMPTNMIFYAIAGFSIGVEAGNQLVLLPLYGILQVERRIRRKEVKPGRSLTLQRIASGVVALAGIYYLATALL